VWLWFCFSFQQELAMISNSFDFEKKGAEEEFQKLIEKVSATPFVYLDWQFANFGANELLGALVPEGTSDNRESAICEKLDKRADGVISVSGKPNKNNNHLLTTISL
jgi:hypothetical protein